MTVSDADRKALTDLAWTWFRARKLGGGLLAALEPVTVPESLAATVTREQPFRRQALDDARYWLAVPQPLGLGMEVYLEEGDLAIRPAPPWSASVAPLRFVASWADRMDAWSQQVESARLSIAQVASEDGEWRVVALWTPEERRQHMKFLEW